MKKKDGIAQLEAARKSRVIAYVTSDRNPFATKIASDVVPLLGNLLDKIGRVNKISLFLYTSGGDMLAPVRIVKLIRSHCKEFEVLVPYKAHSAGTLISLGADSIVMGKLSELTPVDPATGHPFNPQNPTNAQKRVEISVEDLNSYLLFAKERAGIQDDQMIDAYKLLVKQLHPLAIGNAYRAYRMVRFLTERLLWLHTDKEKDREKIQRIVKEITGNITIHAYPIDRDEAADLGLKIEKAQESLDAIMRGLYEHYAVDMQLGQPFHPNELVAHKDIVDIRRAGAYLETLDSSYSFVFRGSAKKGIRDNKPVVDINIESQAWVKQ